MSSSELRQKFLKFFEERGHVIVPSSSLIPDDPSVLLTTAGMQQFKPYYTGELDPMTAIHGALGKPIGSKNAVSIQKSFRTSDIDEVGDESHLTFFEMLGNFSFGGYWKEKAIELAWKFINKELDIPIDRIHVSVFEGNSEIPFDKESYDIWKSLGIPEEKIKKGNRQDNFWGPTGNEGPCGPTTEIYVDGIELWNIVFNEFYCRADKTLEPLKIKGVDTGMGLERLALVMQYPEKPEETIFKTDLFDPIIKKIPAGNEKARRIIADHMRASVFLIADGVQPSNLERGYILRRLLRRAARYAYLSMPPDDLTKPLGWYDDILKSIIRNYREAYPEITDYETIYSVIAKEIEKFGNALDKGLKEFQKLSGDKRISGKEAFNLYQSYGFPIEMIEELANEKNIKVDRAGFDEELKKHQEISRAGLEKKFGGHGLQNLSAEEIRKDPVAWKKTRLHTATHLLHRALRDILGEKVRQMGSDINEERTRFDFAFDRKVTSEELQKIEQEVDQKIAEDLEVIKEEMPYQKAIEEGATAFFKEKYPEIVTVYSIVDRAGKVYSKELCGGPHVNRTSEIGRFKIVKEEAVSAGVRRIRGIIVE